MSPPLKAVTFDLWQTLMHDGKEHGAARAKLRAERIHRALPDAPLKDVEAALQNVWHTWETTYWAKNEDPGFDAQIAWLMKRLAVPPELEAELRAGYVDPIFAIPPHVDPEAVPALTSLRERGLKLGLICNTSVTPGSALRQLLDQWHVGELLMVQLFSDEVGIRKPAPAIFRETARRLGVDIAAMLHVGDRQDADVEGAIGAGAKALLARPQVPLTKLVSTLTST